MCKQQDVGQILMKRIVSGGVARRRDIFLTTEKKDVNSFKNRILQYCHNFKKKTEKEVVIKLF